MASRPYMMARYSPKCDKSIHNKKCNTKQIIKREMKIV